MNFAEFPERLRASTRFALWFLVGVVVVLSFQAFFISRYRGDWTVLVRVGALKPHRALIESELGPLICVDPLGHDGQVNYLIARDPFDRRGTSAILRASDSPAYRYRRILFPLLAGGFGWFGPGATVCGLVFWTAVGGGLVAASCATLCAEWKLPAMVLLFALCDPGIFLSAQVLTNDLLAMGLGLTGVVLWVRGREYSAGLVLAAAVLVRETSILFSLCLAASTFRECSSGRSVRLLAISGLPYLAWSLWVGIQMPGSDGLHNLSLPFVGLFSSISLWRDPARVGFGIVSLAFLAAASVIARTADRPLIRLSCQAWLFLAAILSAAVWEHPGNAIRAIGPLWIFVAFGYGEWKQRGLNSMGNDRGAGRTEAMRLSVAGAD